MSLGPAPPISTSRPRSPVHHHHRHPQAGAGTVQLIRPGPPGKTLAALEGVDRLVTFNGTCFDLPVIRNELGVDLKTRFDHFDLRYACAKQGLKGGLKKIEVLLGIDRDTEGVDGWAAMRLWEEWGQGRKESLDLLLRYNREDIENLPVLEDRISNPALQARRST